MLYYDIYSLLYLKLKTNTYLCNGHPSVGTKQRMVPNFAIFCFLLYMSITVAIINTYVHITETLLLWVHAMKKKTWILRYRFYSNNIPKIMGFYAHQNKPMNANYQYLSSYISFFNQNQCVISFNNKQIVYQIKKNIKHTYMEK